MNKIIKADLFRYGGLTGTSGFIKGLRIPGFRYMYLLRKASKSKKYSLKWLFFTFLKTRYSLDLSCKCNFFIKQCFIQHFIGHPKPQKLPLSTFSIGTGSIHLRHRLYL